MKLNDKVKIISAPVVDNNPSGQAKINATVGKETYVRTIFKYGKRNILCYGGGNGVFNYYSAENLQPVQA